MRERLRVLRALLGVMLVTCCFAALASGTALASDHYYCGSIPANSSCSSGIQHTYANNNVAYAGPSLVWCEGLATPGQVYYSSLCTPGSQGNGYTIYGTWRDWCGYPGGCGWAVNGSTSLYDLANNQGANTHTFTAHSYW